MRLLAFRKRLIPVKKKGESVHMKKVVAMYEQEEAYGKNGRPPQPAR